MSLPVTTLDPHLYSETNSETMKSGREGMAGGCSIRAMWILNNQDIVVFSRRFSVVERRWRAACTSENVSAAGDADDVKHDVLPLLPTDSELAAAFSDRKKREGSARGFGIRIHQSAEGSDSWVDDPITRHILGLYINKEEEGGKYLLWPLILHIKSHFCIVVLPLVEPFHLREYARLGKRSDCGNAVGTDGSVSSFLLDLPSITGAFMVSRAIGDIVMGDVSEPEVVVSASPVGGLLDSLTGSIGISGISARPKPVAAPVAASATLGAAIGGAVASDSPKIGSRSLDKDALRTFISSSMPFGTPLDLSYSNISAIKLYGFASSDLPPADRKQPAWKPYLYKGKQRIIFTIHEAVHAAMYDRDDLPDTLSIFGQVNCRAELEGLPDVSFPMTGLDMARIEVLSFHPCAQVPEPRLDKQVVVFSPPLGNFVLMRYLSSRGIGPPVKGFYQLSMVSENEGAFLFKLRLMDGYKSPLTMEFCTVTMPFPRRRVISFDGTPSIGTISMSDYLVEWKIIASGRGIVGKSIEATFSGTVKFAAWQTQKLLSSGSVLGSVADEDSDTETETTNNVVNVEDFLMEKMNKDLPPVDLEEPFCWQAYDYAKVSFKIVGASLSGMSIDPKSVTIFPSVKAPVEFSTQVTSGDYILWNTLGKCPSAATPTPEQ
ncbi:AP-5 complex subunit mu isoform X1 [Diospyros lotus]|uniref:AP-5 complex subunit mu isoform X1 n=1 Tax=Diospyros lotus TaxID=55363 RepID=UPI002251CE0B|nr:AP-5 complex subunit mu isoform X1 [Diospyros lotus]